MSAQPLQNFDLNQIDEIAFSNKENGHMLVEILYKPETVRQGQGFAPQFNVSGLDVRLDDEDNVEIHNLFLDNILHNAYVQYINFQLYEDGSYEYEGINILIFEEANISANDDDAKFTYSFDTLRDGLLFLKENFQSQPSNINSVSSTSSQSNKSSVIKNPLDKIFGKK